MQDQPGASHQTTRESRVGQPSKRSEIPSFMVMDVMSAAAKAEAEGRHIIHMEVGQPGTPAPEAARAALAANLNNEKLGYTLALGMPVLRQRIAQLYGDWYDVDLSANRIVVTNGSSAAFILAFLTLFEAGDHRCSAVAGVSLLSPHPVSARSEVSTPGNGTGNALDADIGAIGTVFWRDCRCAHC